MYISPISYYYRGTIQCVPKGPFLILAQQADKPIGADNLYAIIRKVALSQLGHWMMGHANIGGKYHSISGAYGNDGLPMTLPNIPRDAIKVPLALYNQLANGKGWNGPSEEGDAFREFGHILSLPCKIVPKRTICGGQCTDVTGSIIYAPGLHDFSPIKKDLTCLALYCGNQGVRYFGIRGGLIGPDLQQHIILYSGRDEVLNTWQDSPHSQLVIDNIYR